MALALSAAIDGVLKARASTPKEDAGPATAPGADAEPAIAPAFLRDLRLLKGATEEGEVREQICEVLDALERLAAREESASQMEAAAAASLSLLGSAEGDAQGGLRGGVADRGAGGGEPWEAVRTACAACTTADLPVVLRHRLPVTCAVETRRLSSADASSHQARLDVERDELLVSGLGDDAEPTLLVGSESKLEGVLRALEGAFDRAIKISSVKDRLWYSPHEDGGERRGKKILVSFAEMVLQAVNRTSSGGTCFDLLLSLVDAHPGLLLRPQSDAIEPLRVSVLRAGRLPPDEVGYRGFGLLVQVDAELRFEVLDGDALELKTALKATFSRTLSADLLPRPAGSVAGEPLRADEARVRVAFVEGRSGA